MLPVSDFPVSEARELRFVLTDIDDTLTDGGKLPLASYRALWQLSEAGLHVIAVTGRPAGWCDLISRHWPVAAVIGENGAFALTMEGETQEILYHPSAPEPDENARRLAGIAEEVFRRVPGTRIAKDQFCRRFDIAIDFREEPPFLSLDAAERIREIFVSHGAQAKISSIHVNAWFGDYDKRSMAEFTLQSRFGLDVTGEAANRCCLYCGDSPNDEPMFDRFLHSVGVANIREFEGALEHPPRFVTDAPASAGFAELATILLRSRE